MAEEKNKLYREEALQSISSPEQLTDYLRVTNPGIWVLLATVILLLAGLLVWSTVGNLETLVRGKAQVEDGVAAVVLTEPAGRQPSAGMTLRIGTEEDTITYVDDDGMGGVVSYAPVGVSNGTYDVTIVVESVHPIQFLLS